MATASEAHPTDRALSDREFEELLQKTWEFVQSQKGVTAVKVVHPFEPSSESPSWT
jgi:ribosome-associated toxin RatA of RatAB toxin-antitoxin module